MVTGDQKNAQNALVGNKITPAIINSNTPEANIALINKIKSKETEKSASKLQMIRNVLIHEIKETDTIKKNVEDFKEYIPLFSLFNFLAQFSQINNTVLSLLFFI